MKRSRKLKGIIGALVCALLLPLCLAACASEPPALEDVRDRFTQLIEASYEVNDIFFGEGLPTYDREDEQFKNL